MESTLLKDFATITKDFLQAFQALITGLGIVLGGIASYFMFFKRRQIYPRAIVTHQIDAVFMSNWEMLLRPTLKIENKGEILLVLERAEARLSRLLPTDGTVHPDRESAVDNASVPAWKEIKNRDWEWSNGEAEVEPGESETLFLDAFVDIDVAVVEVYAYVWNESKKGRNIGWQCVAVHQIKKGESNESTKATITSPSHKSSTR